MSVTFSPSVRQTTMPSLEQAVLETLAYSDIFDYPLTVDELHRYLTVSATKDELEGCLKLMSTAVSAQVDLQLVYYYLPSREEAVELRKSRHAASLKAFNRALKYGRMLGLLPFVRMVAMTGSLAVLNLSKNADMDFMLVTVPNRLWIARAFAVTFGRLMRLTRDRICVNLLVSESALEWPRHDLYSAREMGQMIPIVGIGVYHRLREANPWVESFLPNAKSSPEHSPSNPSETDSWIQRLSEILLPAKFTEWLDGLLMKLQLRKITRKYGQGAEANFNVHVCQGNFHDHRSWADEYFHARLVSLGLRVDEGDKR